MVFISEVPLQFMYVVFTLKKYLVSGYFADGRKEITIGRERERERDKQRKRKTVTETETQRE